MSNEILVKVENVSKKFCLSLKKSLWYGVRDIAGELFCRNGAKVDLRTDEFWAVNDVSFELRRGECLGLIGPNGAGKSTLLKMLNGLIKPDGGKIHMRGRIGALIQLGAGFNPILTGRENIYVNGAVLGIPKKEIDRRLEEILEFAEIGEFIDTPVQSYSSGMKVRLGFSVAAHLRPHILLVDEVLAVGDVGFRMKCYKHILHLMDEGISIIFVTHAVNQLSRVTDRTVVLDKGLKVFDGPLPVGIGIYENLVRTSQETETPVVNGRPRIEYVRLVDHHRHEKREFLTGETIFAEISLITENPVHGARLRAFIESPSVGVLGSFGTPYTDFNFNLNPPRTIIRLILPDFPLLIGGYYLNVALWGSGMTDLYDSKAPGIAFQIIGPTTAAFGRGLDGLIKFGHKWEMITKN